MDQRPAYLRGRGRGVNANQSNSNVNNIYHPPIPIGRGGYDPKTSNINNNKSNKPANRKPQTVDNSRKNVSQFPQRNDQIKKSGIELFESAAAEHRKAAEMHLKPQSSLSSPSDDDDDDEDDDEVKKRDAVFNNMLTTVNKGSLDVMSRSDLGRTGDYINETMKNRANICLICIETVKKTDPIWNCSGCYTMIHIQCIQMWIRDGAYQASSSALSDDLFPNKELPWFCPKCRCSYSQSEFPSIYLCFCCKTENPAFDMWLVPHSCGQVCKRALKPLCGHACLLLCHPGPCPPCPQTVKTKCFCGRADAQVRRCGSSSSWSCGGVCGRQLACGHHVCMEVCHKGPCKECTKRSTQRCLCGRSIDVVPCSNPTWKCQQVCKKPLSCGHHDCPIVCHHGDCPPCPKSGPRSCPCGKTRFELPCTEDVPSCAETCNKLLECGFHRCIERCHMGECGMCRELIKKRCRCGKKEKEVHCYKDYQCDTKCPNLKDCGVHQCRRKCCDGTCPPCTAVCGKMLACRQHKCNSTCHRGPCYPCCLVATVQCNCGLTMKNVPCGAERRAKPPKCHRLCSKPPDCHHPSRLPHPCHFGPCPRCVQTCEKQLSCLHSCPAACHSAVEVKARDNQMKAGPWELVKEKIEVVSKECPPCLVPVSVTCFGGHETITVKCCDARPSSCHKPCNRLLKCTNHKCTTNCHVVTGGSTRSDGVSLAGTNCESCDRPCEKPRHPDCPHKCPLPCHQGACPPCSQMVRMRCHCQMVVKHIPCHQWCFAEDGAGGGDTGGGDTGGLVRVRNGDGGGGMGDGSGGEERDALKSCGSRCPKMLPCTHQCKSTCHHGLCPPDNDCSEKVKVRCSCGRRRAEFECRVVLRGGAKVDCNQSCELERERARMEKEEDDRRRAEQEAEKHREEVERFDKRMKGEGHRKRHRKSLTDQDADNSFLSKYQNYFVLSALVVIFSVCLYWLLVQ